MSDLANPNPVSAATANPAASEPVVASGTVQPNSQAVNGQGAPVEDSFTKLDPNTLPPQLKAAYDNMLKDYKSKTTELSEQRKKYADYDDLKQKAGFYDQFSSREDAVKWWNEYVQKQNGQNAGTETQDPVQAKLQELEKKLEAEQQARQQSELAEIVDAFSTATDENGQPLRPDFESLNGINLGKTVEGEDFSLLRACIDLSPGKTPQEKLDAGYKAAKAIRDQIFEEGRKHGMGKMLSKVRNSTEAPTITSDKQTFTGDPKKLSVTEARELAQRGVLVH